MNEKITVNLKKAIESLAGAESEFSSGRYNNCANRCYYGCFQAVIAALSHEGVKPDGAKWSHGSVLASFDGLLINRRKLYSTELRSMLVAARTVRQAADYGDSSVSETEAARILRRTRLFVTAIRQRLSTEGTLR